MTVKIVRPACERRYAACPGCESLIEYSPPDALAYDRRDMIGGEGVRYVPCPNCNKKVTVRPWGKT